MADKSDSGEMGGFVRSANEIRDDIAARRESITQTVGQLEKRIHQTLDLRGYVARHPYKAVGLAVGTGLIIGGMLKRKSSPTERIADAIVDMAEELSDSLRGSVRKLIMRTAAPSLFRGTISGIAGRALIQYLQNRAMHAGNGANPVHEEQWRNTRSTTSTPPNVSPNVS